MPLAVTHPLFLIFIEPPTEPALKYTLGRVVWQGAHHLVVVLMNLFQFHFQHHLPLHVVRFFCILVGQAHVVPPDAQLTPSPLGQDNLEDIAFVLVDDLHHIGHFGRVHIRMVQHDDWLVPTRTFNQLIWLGSYQPQLPRDLKKRRVFETAAGISLHLVFLLD